MAHRGLARRAAIIIGWAMSVVSLSAAQPAEKAAEAEAKAAASNPASAPARQPAALASHPAVKPPPAEGPEGTALQERSPPANDACAAALPISGTGTFAFDNSEATQDGLAHFFCNFFGQSQIDRDVWFKWTAPTTASYTVDTCTGTAIDTKIAVYTNVACPPDDDALISCNDESCSLQSRVTFSAILGHVYLIRIGSYPGSPGGSGSLRVQFQSGQNLCSQLAANCQVRDNSNGFDATGRLVKDDFRVAQDVVINKLCFWGGYFSASGGCTSIPPDHFIITYYDDSGGAPGVPIATFTQGADFVLGGPVPTGSTIAGAAGEYAYTLTHPPVQLYADNCYWVEIFNDLTGGTCAWYWEKGAGGNGAAVQDFTVIASDLAFCLNTPLAPASLCQAPGPPSNDTCANAKPLFNGETTTAQNLFATTDPSDPAFPCRTGGTAQGVGTLWYQFVAAASSVRINTCNTPQGDTLLALYSGSCGNLSLIACNDDTCGFRSQLCAAGLVVGQTYYVQFAVYDESRRGAYSLNILMPCPLPPTHDSCAGAITINYSGGFGGFNGSTALATTDGGAPGCELSPVAAPGVWHKVVGNGQTLTASLCGSEYDTKINVYCGSCPQLNCVAHNDDFCGPQSEISWCSEPGRTYYLLVFGFNGAVGEYTLFLTSDGSSCTPFPSCTTCSLTCPPNSIAENEACAGAANNGCNSESGSVQTIQCGQSICGTASTTGLTRDTDWYEFSISSASIVSWSAQAELPVELYLLDTRCIPEPGILAHATMDQCGTAAAIASLEPGTYRAFVGNIGDAFPCGTSNRYIATLSCTPIGACCTSNDCFRTTQSNCATLGGQYAGDNSSCATAYSLSACASAFEDISAGGTAVAFGGDSDAEPADIGFPFRFFGVETTTLAIAADGYLSLVPASSSEPLNTTLPNTAAPNGLIAPLWDDLAPTAGGSVRHQTLGSAPNRRFIVQWKAVPQFLVADANTFQAVLFEGTNCIEFRYGPMTPEATAGDYTIGVENQLGTRATSASAATISQGACLRFCPTIASTACSPPGCPGDANHDGRTNFSDITAVLFNWGGTGSQGDANNDGQVTFADITDVLTNFGCTPQTCPGDANHNNTVGFSDITAVMANLGSTGPQGDANGDGLVNFADITSVLANFGSICLP